MEQKEEYLIEFERRMLDQKKGLLFFKLPEQSEIPVTNSFIRKMPMYVDNICKFKSDVDRLTKEFCEKFSQDKEDNKELLKAYFVGIGMYVSNDLFGSSGTNIRTHFRILRNGQHVKYTAVLGSIISNDKITEIPQNSNSMIDRSFQLKKSLIASLNPEYNYDTKTKWDDYMTITYYNLKSCDEPFLSMAISIKYVEQYGDMLYFLNFYKIEECMDSYIKMWYCKYVEVRSNNMAIVVSKVDALLEMVKAYDNNQVKRSNCIGRILSNSIQKDNQNNMYSCYIDLDRSTKQYFPKEIKKNSKKMGINDEFVLK